MSDKNSTNISTNVKTKYNYTELGGPDRPNQRMYNNGENFIHPSGVEYVRVNGNWKIKKKDDDSK